MHNLCLEVLIVHGTELRLFRAKVFSLLILLILRITDWLLYVLCHGRGFLYAFYDIKKIKETINELLPVFENFLDRAPKDKSYDGLRQSVVVLMGSMAQHLDSDNPKVCTPYLFFFQGRFYSVKFLSIKSPLYCIKA